jgi:hypothetical protein
VSSDTVVPVIAGLAVGIAFIAIFSTGLKSPATTTDEEIRQFFSQYPEVIALKERYGNVVEEIHQVDGVMSMQYIATRDPIEQNADSFRFLGPRMLVLTLTIQPFPGTAISVTCGSGLAVELAPTAESIRTTNCLETE